MLQPINYSLNVKTPFEAAVEGYKVGLAGQESLAQRQALEAQRAKALAEAKKARTEATRMANYQASLARITNNPNATAKDFIDLSANAPPGERENVQAAWKMLSEAEKQNRLKIGGQVMSAFNANKPEAAIAVLQEQLAGYKGAGREKDATDTEALINLIKENPQNGKLIFGPSMAAIPEFKDVLEASLKPDKRYVATGDKIYLMADIEAAIAAAEQTGSQTVTLPVAIPPQAMAFLRANPNTKANFDQKYGAGAADKVLGVKK